MVCTATAVTSSWSDVSARVVTLPVPAGAQPRARREHSQVDSLVPSQFITTPQESPPLLRNHHHSSGITTTPQESPPRLRSHHHSSGITTTPQESPPLLGNSVPAGSRSWFRKPASLPQTRISSAHPHLFRKAASLPQSPISSAKPHLFRKAAPPWGVLRGARSESRPWGRGHACAAPPYEYRFVLGASDGCP